MTKKVKLDEIRAQRGKTDWAYLKKENSQFFMDPDAPELTPAQLSQMRPAVKALEQK